VAVFAVIGRPALSNPAKTCRAVAGLGSCYKGGDEITCGRGNFCHRLLECGLVDSGGRVEAAQLADKLQRGVVDFRLRCGRLEIEKCFDVPAHSPMSLHQERSGARLTPRRG